MPVTARKEETKERKQLEQQIEQVEDDFEATHEQAEYR